MADSIVLPPPPGPRGIGAGRRPMAVLTALAAVGVVVVVPALYQWVYRDVVFPGVRIAGIHVGGRSARAALARLKEAGIDAESDVTLRTGDQVWSLRPEASGLAFDANATVTKAWEVGRSGPRPRAVWDMVTARWIGHPVAPIVSFDATKARAALADIAGRFDRPPQNAGVLVEGTVVRTTAATVGHTVIIPASLEALEMAAAAGVWPVRALELAVETRQPDVTDAGPALEAAQALLGEPLTLRESDQSWPLSPAELAPMLTTKFDEGSVKLDIDRTRLREWLGPITVAISRTAELPRFHLDDSTHELVVVKPGRSGQSLDLEDTAERVLGAARTGGLVRLALTIIPPAVADAATAEELGLRELLRSETSRFAGSAPERIHNIAVAASQYDGLLVPPDSVFSFDEHLGDVSIERGYKKALIIMDGATRDGVGGGVCQVSTTLFRAAFWSGFPIVERTPHGYRVPYYEQGAPVGFDATVYSPVVDLKFKNDTGAWLLIESETNKRGTTTTFRIYGTMPVREVALEGPVTGKPVAPPPPRTQVDEALAPGQTKIVEYARTGLSVALTRVIRTPGQEEVREVYRSHYVPTGQITAVGPSAGLPPPPGAEAAAVPPTGDATATQTTANPAPGPGGGPPPP